jgi:hypothetical protein
MGFDRARSPAGLDSWGDPEYKAVLDDTASCVRRWWIRSISQLHGYGVRI